MNKDMFGANVVIGDYVIVVQKSYRNMIFARVVGLTPKQIRVVYPASFPNNLHPETYLTGDFVKVSQDQMNTEPDKKRKIDEVFAKHMNIPFDQVV